MIAREDPLARDARTGQPGETLGALGGAYWQSLTALTQLTVSLLPSVGRVDQKEKSDER